MSIFGGNTGVSYDELQRRKKLAQNLMRPQAGKMNTGDGLRAIGNALIGRAIENKADRQQSKMQSQFDEQYGKVAPKQGQAIADLYGNPMASDAQKKILGALMGQAGVPGYSRGGKTRKDGLIVVGEAGPEVLQAPKGTEIEPIDPAVIDPALMDDAQAPGMFNQIEGRFDDANAVQVAGELPYGDTKMTGDQSKAIAYYRRGYGANQTLDDPKMSEALTQYTDSFAGNFGSIGRMFQDADYQVANRAASEFLAAILRKDTGAAITNQEFELYGPMYLPQPGDKPELLEAKRKARQEALTAIEMGLGTAAPLASQTREELAPDDPAGMSDEDLKKALGL